MFNPISSRAAACAAACLLSLPAFAASPDHGTVTDTARTQTWTVPFSPTANASGQTSSGAYTCDGAPTNPCDTYTLTVTLPAGYRAAHPNSWIHIEAATTSNGSDIDMQLEDASGKVITFYRDNPPSQPFIDYKDLKDGTTVYKVQVVPGTPHEGGSGSVTLNDGAPPPPPDADGDGVGDADDLCPGTPPGTSVDSKGCALPAGNPATCTAPGLTILTDATGDSATGTPGTDLKSLQVFQPQQAGGGNHIENQLIAFRINIDANATLNPSTSYFTSFRAPAGLLGVRMTGTSSGAPLFQSYTPGASNSGAQDGRFYTATQPADASSSFNAATGAITIVVKATDLGFTAPGQTLSEFNAGVTVTSDPANVGAGATSVVDGMPSNDLSRSTASYTLHDNTVCGNPRLLPIGPPPPATGLPPRFYFFQSPEGLADSAGEPSIGYNPATQHLMFVAGTEVDRITFAENAWAPPLKVVDVAGDTLPESCEAIWSDASYAGAANTLDPILETHQPVGRTFQSQLSGANSLFSYSDDDGLSWTPGQAGPPNGGADHQTIGVGPWPAGSKPPTAAVDYAVYYCSQSVAAAFCARSDDGGVTFGPGVAFRNSGTDCNNSVGALHGHVQVGPDGSVWVPFGNCGAKTAVSVSLDAGVTWTVRTIPQSAPSGDPGLGIARDGTAYMCYDEGGGHVYASVSKDHGSSWLGHYDIGTATGIVNSVFTTAVAGDPDRAACAFVGTTTPGNYQGLDFPGIWYPFVAMTYDGGKSWHTVNVSPGDPIQGAGGVCTGGTTCGSNRNMLDFNDIQLDQDGRVMFGMSDGCKGACVGDPTHNSFTDNGVFARQSGGRTLFAARDNLAATQFNSDIALKPKPACPRQELSTRNAAITRLAWLAPDNGGSAVTHYHVYRTDDLAHPFSPVGDAGSKTYFVDATADTAVPKYYYKVTAENDKGVSGYSNTIELPIAVGSTESSCALPGVTVTREGNAGDCTGTGGGCVPQTDLQKLSVAELQASPSQFVVVVKVGDLNPAPAPNTFWYVLLKKKDGSNLYLAMDTSGGVPAYTYGTYDVSTVTTFTQQGTLDSASSNNPDGSIYLVVDRALLGYSVGDTIVGMEARTRTGASAAPSRDVLAPGDYTVLGTNVCLANTPPLAALDATPLTGAAPLTVAFSGAGSTDPDTSIPDTIKTWLINFGDGTGDTAQAPNPPTWTHVYAADGVYRATLKVIDSRGMASENLATRTIEVGVPAVVEPGNNRLGGALPAPTLALLGLAALLRRRRRH